MNDPDFTPEHVKNVSVAASSLCLWVRAMYTYDQVAKGIAPKKANLLEAQQKMTKVWSCLKWRAKFGPKDSAVHYLQVEAELSQKQGALQAILAKVASLKQQLQAAQTEKARLESQAAITKTQLSRAEKLVSSLANEKGRWNMVWKLQ